MLKNENRKLSMELASMKKKIDKSKLATQDPLETHCLHFEEFKIEKTGDKGYIRKNWLILLKKIGMLQPTKDTKYHFLCKECQISGKSLENLKLHLTLKHPDDRGELAVQHFSGQNGLEIFIKFAIIEVVKHDSDVKTSQKKNQLMTQENIKSVYQDSQDVEGSLILKKSLLEQTLFFQIQNLLFVQEYRTNLLKKGHQDL